MTALPVPADSITVEEAIRRVLDATTVLPPVRVPLTEATGLVLAEPLIAGEDLPPFPASTMDGYAVVAADGSGWRELIGEQMAGYVADLVVRPGTVARITTGSPVPPGADAVVMVENTREVNGRIEIRQGRITAGENIRPIGVDMARGQQVLAAGTTIGPAEMGLLASLGHAEPLVHPRPRGGGPGGGPGPRGAAGPPPPARRDPQHRRRDRRALADARPRPDSRRQPLRPRCRAGRTAPAGRPLRHRARRRGGDARHAD